jgi:hypothetical protein
MPAGSGPAARGPARVRNDSEYNLRSQSRGLDSRVRPAADAQPATAPGSSPPRFYVATGQSLTYKRFLLAGLYKRNYLWPVTFPPLACFI